VLHDHVLDAVVSADDIFSSLNYLDRAGLSFYIEYWTHWEIMDEMFLLISVERHNFNDRIVKVFPMSCLVSRNSLVHQPHLGVDIQSFWLHQESHAVGFDGHQRDERMEDIIHFLMDFSAFTIACLLCDLLPEVFQQHEIFLIHPLTALIKIALEGLFLQGTRGDDVIQSWVESQVVLWRVLSLLTGVVVVPGVHVRQDVKVIIECRDLDVRLHGLVVSVVGQVNVKLVNVPEV